MRFERQLGKSSHSSRVPTATSRQCDSHFFSGEVKHVKRTVCLKHMSAAFLNGIERNRRNSVTKCKMSIHLHPDVHFYSFLDFLWEQKHSLTHNDMR